MASQVEMISLLEGRDQKAISIVKHMKINKAINLDFASDTKSHTLINDTVEVYELAIIELWKFAFDKSAENHKQLTQK